ncbi:MAG: hypothetical protein ACRDPM_24385, partial [Solirubrobacteraceae bacterium]
MTRRDDRPDPAMRMRSSSAAQRCWFWGARRRGARLAALALSVAIALGVSLTTETPAVLADGSMSLTPPAGVVSVEGPDGGLEATIDVQGTLPTPPAQAGPGTENGAHGYTLYASVRKSGRCDPANPIYDNDHGGIWSEYGVPGAAFKESFVVDGESLYNDNDPGVQSFPVCAWLAVPDNSGDSAIVVAFAESQVSFRRPRSTLRLAFPRHLHAHNQFTVTLTAWTTAANTQLYAEVFTAAFVDRHCRPRIPATPPEDYTRQWRLPTNRHVKHSLRLRLPAGAYRLCVEDDLHSGDPWERLLR